MQWKPVGSNMNEIVVEGKYILFSYQTPVAGWDESGAFRTEDFFSVTTSKHIKSYLGGKDIGTEVDQQWLNNLVA